MLHLDCSWMQQDASAIWIQNRNANLAIATVQKSHYLILAKRIH